MRCDLHVHTRHSGMCSIPVLRSVCRECYSEPAAVYEKLKRMGMGLVTVTDHDSIDAVEELRHHPDFFLSQEVTCHMPSGNELHVGVYDITDRQHIQLQRRAADLPNLLAYLNEQNIFFSANHIFSGLTGRRDHSDFEWFQSAFPAFETRNGCMLETSNASASRLAETAGKVGLGGSDAHTLASAGSCWTEVAGARDKQEFFAGLRNGRATVKGSHGNYWKLTRDVLQIGGHMLKEKPLTSPMVMLGVLAPVVTAANYVLEKRFSHVWSRRLNFSPLPQEAPERLAA